MRPLTEEQAQTALALHHHLLVTCHLTAFARAATLRQAAPTEYADLSDRSLANFLNDFVCCAVDAVFRGLPGVAVHHVGKERLTLLGLQTDEGALVLRFGKNGHNAERRGNDTQRWEDFERHALPGFPDTTHLVVGYLPDPVTHSLRAVTITCPYPKGTLWSYQLVMPATGTAKPAAASPTLPGMPPAVIRSARPARDVDADDAEGGE